MKKWTVYLHIWNYIVYFFILKTKTWCWVGEYFFKKWSEIWRLGDEAWKCKSPMSKALIYNKVVQRKVLVGPMTDKQQRTVQRRKTWHQRVNLQRHIRVTHFLLLDIYNQKPISDSIKNQLDHLSQKQNYNIFKSYSFGKSKVHKLFLFSFPLFDLMNISWISSVLDRSEILGILWFTVLLLCRFFFFIGLGFISWTNLNLEFMFLWLIGEVRKGKGFNLFCLAVCSLRVENCKFKK